MRVARRLRPRSVSRLPRSGRRPRSKRGATFFEQTRVKKVRVGAPSRRSRRGRRRDQGARTVIVATGSATAEFRPLRRHFKLREIYHALTEPMPAAMRKQVGNRGVTVQDPAGAGPPRRVDERRAAAGGRRRSGRDRRRGGATTCCVQRTGQLMYEALTMYPAIAGPAAGVGLGARRTARPPTACRTSARTATTRGISSRSAAPAIRSPARSSPRASSCARCRAQPEKSDAGVRVDAMSAAPGAGGSARVRPAPRRHRDRHRRHRRQARALGPSRRAVRSHRRRDGQQRHGGRAAGRGRGGARGARRARGASTCACPIGRSASSPDHARAVAGLVRRARPRAVAVPYWSDRHPDHVRASELLTEAIFSAGLRRFDAEGEAWKPDVGLLLLHQRSRGAVVRGRRERRLRRRSAARWPATSPSSRRAAPDAVATRLTSSRFQQLIESRDAQFGAQAGVAFAEGFVVRQTLRAAGPAADRLARPGIP